VYLAKKLSTNSLAYAADPTKADGCKTCITWTSKTVNF